MGLQRLPKIIQGGMGVAVSNYLLARTISSRGPEFLGVVSGTGIDTVLVRKLQTGDERVLGALRQFPDEKLVQEIENKYFIPGGKAADQKFLYTPRPHLTEENGVFRLQNNFLEKLLIAANFTEVRLAKEGHNNPVAVNLLHKIAWPMLPSIYGAILAGADAVLMGAGMPKEIPSVLDNLTEGERATMPLEIWGIDGGTLGFNPQEFYGTPKTDRPDFFGIISTDLMLRALPNTDGYIVEHHSAGGHNAPPRTRDPETREKYYGEKDEANFEKIHHAGKPFYVAGSHGHPDGLTLARAVGAQGIQVGTLFSHARESGFTPEANEAMYLAIMSGAVVIKDMRASPTKYPFNVLPVSGSLSEEAVYQGRERICDLSYLIEHFKKEDGSIGMRCPSEPIQHYLKKGGKREETIGRKCLCNALVAAAGYGQRTKGGGVEEMIFTSGEDLSGVIELRRRNGGQQYVAHQALDYLLEKEVA